MKDPYFEGIAAGERGDDTRSCPWESTKNVNDWLTGYSKGAERRLAAEKAAEKQKASSS